MGYLVLFVTIIATVWSPGLWRDLLLTSKGVAVQAQELSPLHVEESSSQDSSYTSLPRSSQSVYTADSSSRSTQPKAGTKYTFLASDCKWGTSFDVSSDGGTVGLYPVNSTRYSSVTGRYVFDCLWRVSVPVGRFIKIQVQDESFYSCDDRQLDIGDAVYSEVVVAYSVYLCENGKYQATYSVSNIIYVSISSALVLPPEGQSWLTFHFEATDVSGRLTLPVVMTSDTSGYVLSHEGVDQGTKYLPLMNASATVNVPVGYAVIYSFKMFKVDNPSTSSCFNDDRLVFYEINSNKYRSTSPRILATLSSCKKEVFFPKMLRSSLLLQFITDDSFSNFGFKMLFTLVPSEEAPNVIEESGLWDCSQPVYSKLKEHFECNLEYECLAREDEINCPHTVPACAGSLALPDSCLTYVTQNSTITWYEANRECQKRQSRLVTLNTEQKWMLFLGFFLHGKKQWPVHIGARKILAGDALPRQYSRSWWWTDGSVAYSLNVDYQRMFSQSQTVYKGWENYACAYFDVSTPAVVYVQHCNQTNLVSSFVCEKSLTSAPVAPVRLASRQKSSPGPLWIMASLSECQHGQLTRDFLSCEPSTNCKAVEDEGVCTAPGAGSMPKFTCGTTEHVHYTLVCDYRPDCVDGSDENFCAYPVQCSDTACSNGQCLLVKDFCDVMEHCVDGSDELGCLTDGTIPVSTGLTYLPPPALVLLDGHGRAFNEPLETPGVCPATHFLCPQSYCVPVFLRCNGVYDCPGKEDEADCQNYTCPGFYQCRRSTVCLHIENLCDGIFQCPLQDDEWMCDRGIDCPQGCVCQGLAFVCHQSFPADAYPEVRYLNAAGSGMTVQDLSTFTFLIYLSLARCGLQSLAEVTFPNLKTLDVSENQIEWLDMKAFLGLRNLRVLILSKNPLYNIFNSEPNSQQETITTIDFSFASFTRFDSKPLSSFPSLSKLLIMNTPMVSISDDGFRFTSNLAELNLSGSDVRSFPNDLLKGLTNLQLVVTDNYKLCCKATLPELFDEKNCLAPQDELSSCDDLLRSDAYRGCLWLFSALSIFGNAGSLVIRLLLQKSASKSGYNVLVTHLSVADLLMGVYLAMVGGADGVYRGVYLWNENDWRNSHVCRLAGFLSLLSKEMSAITICVITLDRFIVLHFPFTPFRLQRKSATLVAGVCWVVSIAIAAVPLLPFTSHWEFYSQTGICIPLPITRKAFPGQNYSFGVLIVFNFVLFLLVAFGQAFIFWSLHSNRLTTESTKKSQDLTIARRLITIALTDFLCWFPVGLLGLMAASGTPISGELNVAMAIFVLPLNPALNPFLYTFNMIMEKRRRDEQVQIRKYLEEKAARQSPTKELQAKSLKPLNTQEALDHLKLKIEEGDVRFSEVMFYLKNGFKAKGGN